MSFLDEITPASWIGAAVKGIVGQITGLIDQYVEDKDKANELKAQLESQLLSGIQATVQAQAKIVLAEARGESWIQRSWRPILMLSVVAIIVNNYVVYPYLSLFTSKAVMLELPDALWSLLQIGVGGYIVGRSGEKIVDRWKGGSTKGEVPF